MTGRREKRGDNVHCREMRGRTKMKERNDSLRSKPEGNERRKNT